VLTGAGSLSLDALIADKPPKETPD